MVDDNKQMLTRHYASPHRVSTPPPTRGPVSVGGGGGCSFAVSVCFQLKFFFFWTTVCSQNPKTRVKPKARGSNAARQVVLYGPQELKNEQHL